MKIYMYMYIYICNIYIVRAQDNGILQTDFRQAPTHSIIHVTCLIHMCATTPPHV